MKCPNCNYTHGLEWVDDEHVEVEGKEGDFYYMSVVMECKSSSWWWTDTTDKKHVYGCPECKILFMD